MVKPDISVLPFASRNVVPASVSPASAKSPGASYREREEIVRPATIVAAARVPKTPPGVVNSSSKYSPKPKESKPASPTSLPLPVVPSITLNVLPSILSIVINPRSVT